MSTNIPRITQKIFAQNAAEDDLLQFGSVLSGNATPSTSIAETQTEAYQTGWRSAVISDRNYPTLGEMNAVQQVPTQQLAYLFQKGIAEWDENTTYFSNVSYCQVNGVLYQSVSDNNIGNNPTTDNGTNWIIADSSNKLTNCILSAPNGVATYSGTQITIKSGLRFIPINGRNADGTLNSVTETLSEDIVATAALNGTRFIVLQDTGSGWQYSNILPSNIAFQTSEPSSGVGLWIDPNTYIAKSASSSSPGEWTTCKAAIIGVFTANTSAITSLTPYQPVELAKQQDLDGMWVKKDLTLISGNTTLNSSDSKTYDLSDYFPTKNNVYEIIILMTGVGTNGIFDCRITTDLVTNVAFGETNVNSRINAAATIPLRNKQITISNVSSGDGSISLLRIAAYRKVR